MERRAARGSAITLRPSISASPWSGFSTVYNMRSVVDLPAPLGPNKPVICPSRALKLTPRTAATLPKDLQSPRASSISDPRTGSWGRPGERGEEGHGRQLLRAGRVQILCGARADEGRDHAIDAGRSELAVPVAGDDHVFAVGEGALREIRVLRWRHRIIGTGQQQRGRRALERRV